MERPTCKTCPYWKGYSRKTQEDERDGLFGNVNLGDALRGHCQANPPSAFMEAISDIDECEAVFPLTWFDTSCGKHPSFPAYIASLKPDPEPPDHVQTKIISQEDAELLMKQKWADHLLRHGLTECPLPPDDAGAPRRL